MNMEKKLIRVKYNEKRLNFLDATLPYLILTDGTTLYNFDYYATKLATFIREVNEYNSPVVPFKLWNFKGEDLHTYSNHIEYLEFDQAVVYEAAKEVYDDENEEFWLLQVQEHLDAVNAMDDGICDARSDIESTFEAEKKENERRQNLLQSIADKTANDPDALPSPEVMQLRQDANNKLLDDAFGANTETTAAGIVVEKPKLITSAFENTPTKLVL